MLSADLFIKPRRQVSPHNNAAIPCGVFIAIRKHESVRTVILQRLASLLRTKSALSDSKKVSIHIVCACSQEMIQVEGEVTAIVCVRENIITDLPPLTYDEGS